MLIHYLKLTWKVLNRRRFFTFINLFGICFTLIILTIITVFMDHAYGPHYPEVHSNRMLGVFEIYWKKREDRWADATPGYTFLDKYIRGLPHTEAVSITTRERYIESISIQGLRVDLRRADSDFWRVMQFEFVEGGPYTNQMLDTSHFVAVISASMKERLFGSSAAVGEMISIKRDSFRVVGVVKDVSRSRALSYADIWAPIRTMSKGALDGDFGRLQALILAKNRSDFSAIRQALALRLKDGPTMRLQGKPSHYVTIADTYFEYTARQYFDDRDAWFFHGENIYTDYSWVYLARLVGIMFLIMVLPAVNLINLNVSRLMERASEIGVRKAYGASSRKLIGQFVFENVMLTLAGGLISFAVSYGILEIYFGILGANSYGSLLPNMRVLGYGLLITLVFGILSSVYPAWRMSRLHPAEILSRRAL